MTPTIVAEIGANHRGRFSTMMQLMRAAYDAGADAIKIQTFTPEQMAEDKVIERGPWAGRNAIDLYRQAYTPHEWHRDIFIYARELGIECFSSVFHPDDVEFLEALGCPRYKIASFEITDLALIRAAASTQKPVIISTGMASLDEIDIAYANAKFRTLNVTLLKCTSAYPAPLEDANLATMTAMQLRYNGNIGLSDHTKGIMVPVAATALGAVMIEKHLRLHGDTEGLDAAFSLDPEEFTKMVTACRQTAKVIGTVHWGPTASEMDHLAFRRPSGGKRLS